MREKICLCLTLLFLVSSLRAGQGPLPVKHTWHHRTSRRLHPLLFQSGELVISAVGDEDLLALQIENGQPKWRYEARSKVLWPTITAAGYRQRLAHYQGLLSFCCADGSIRVIELDQGDVRWQRRLPTQAKWSPTVTPLAFCVACDSNRVYGYDHERDDELWSFQCRRKIVDPPQAAGYGLLIATKGKELIHLHSRTGEELWRKRFPALTTPPPLVTTDCIYVTTNKGDLLALSDKDGQVLWQQYLGLFAHRPLPWNDKVIVTLKNGLILSIDGPSGNIVWQHQSGYALPQSPSPFDSVIHSPIISSRLLVYSTYFGDAMHGLAITSGRLLWRYRGGPDWTKPAALNNIALLFGNRDSYLHGMNGYVGAVLWKSKLDAPLATVPLILGKRIIVGTTEGTIYAVDDPYFK